MSQVIPEASAGDTGSMSRYVPIERDDSTNSWSAVCPYCKSIVFSLTDEAVARGPRRASGSSQLLPVTMTARHECKVSK